ncbi:MAG: hypothetical protein ACREIV_13710, partial [Planctomycetaceae bacterium]
MKYYFLGLGTLLFVCVGCLADGQQIIDKGEYHAPPAQQMLRPGPMVDGPGPGVLPMPAPPPVRAFATANTQIRFRNPPGMSIGWLTPTGFAEHQVITPGRYAFPQGATYRLKLTDVPGREGLVLYPTMQVYPAHPTTDAYLAHNAIPIEITEADLDQVENNNFVTKVIYLPDEQYQEFAVAGVETLVSTVLLPGVDPVAEADRRGTIMVVMRVGNMDLEMPGARLPLRPPGFPGVPPVPGAPRVPAVPPAGPATTGYYEEGGIQQVQHEAAAGVPPTPPQIVPPMPVAPVGSPGALGVPGPMIFGEAGPPGLPAYHPVAGVGGAPSWGSPYTGNPIGLPGPPHLPYG